MANERFKVKFGLAVGDTSATIDATTGDIVTNGDIQLGGNTIKKSGGTPVIEFSGTNLTTLAGDLEVDGNSIRSSTGVSAIEMTGADVAVQGNLTVVSDLGVNGGDITTNQTTGTVFNTTATTVKLGEAATTVSIGATTGTTTINNSLVADDISVTTVDTTNLEVTNIKARDGTAAMTIADTTGIVTVSTQLNVDNINVSGNTISSTNTNGDILITPNGTGDVDLVTDTVVVGDGNATATVTTNGTGDLVLNTNAGTNAGNITLVNGVNGNINLTPNGTGAVVISVADITNLEVANIRATDGTIAATIDNVTGVVNVISALNVDNININGNTISSTNTNGDILITPNGTGDVDLVTDTVQIGDANATATLTTNGTGDLVLNTNAGTNAGSITLVNGVNGNITMAPNGTGNVSYTFTNGGNILNNRNYVFGALRNATTTAAGDIWSLNQSVNSTPARGLSLDNSADTTRTSMFIARNYGAAAPNRARLVFERSRGTAASPAAVAIGDLLGEVDATGYTSTGWINDLYTVVPAFFGFTATENWVANTNLGSNFNLTLAPTATTINTNADLITCIQTNPQAAAVRADVLGMGQGKTAAFVATGCAISGTTLTIGTVTSGTVATGQLIQNAISTINPSCYIVSGSGSTWTLSIAPGNQTGQTITGRVGFVSAVSGTTAILNNLRLHNNVINNSANQTQVTLSTDRSTLLLVGDTITMDTVSGTDMLVLNPGNAKLSSNIITLEDSAGADYLVLNSTSATFTKPVGFPVYTIATKPASGAVGQQISISDSATTGGKAVDGMMAFWETTNGRWAYVSDNLAV